MSQKTPMGIVRPGNIDELTGHNKVEETSLGDSMTPGQQVKKSRKFVTDAPNDWRCPRPAQMPSRPQRICIYLWRKKSVLVVTPETVVRWHRAGFRLYWSLISKVRKQVGRKRLSGEVRKLIFRMVAENPTWGAPRIHGELLMLGFDVSQRTISRLMKRAPREPRPAKRWRAVRENRREASRAMDFLPLPPLTLPALS